MEKINKLRENFRTIRTIVIIVSVVLALLLFILFVLLKCSEVFLSIFPFLIIVDVLIIAVIHYNMVLKPFKLEFVGSVLKEYKPGIVYSFKCDGESYKGIIKKYRLIPSASTFNFTDMVEDDVEGVKYVSMDLHATHTTSNGKSSTTVTDFKGRIYRVHLGANYCDYIVREQRWKNNLDEFEFLDLESIEFNKKFNLYVKDTHEAHKIFTPSKIKNFIELEAKYDNVMTVLHIGEFLYILLYDNSNIFEKMDNAKVTIIHEYKKQYDTLKAYLDVINK